MLAALEQFSRLSQPRVDGALVLIQDRARPLGPSRHCVYGRKCWIPGSPVMHRVYQEAVECAVDFLERAPWLTLVADSSSAI